jgi:holliday junction DNA helicase RuvA
MIGSLNGTIELLNPPFAIIDVNGVGYRVLIPNSFLLTLSLEQKIKLYTYTYVREDALDLFGFENAEDLRLFENLISVSGVGPKTALNIFSFAKREEITGAIIRGDFMFFSQVPRLGQKNAQKIIVELKSKLGSLGELDLSGKDIAENTEVVQALKSFGFSTGEATRALREVDKTGKTTEEKIRLALRYLGKK